MKKLLIIAGVVAALSIFNIFSQDKNIKQMTTEELKVKQKTDSSLVILDVRSPAELQGELGHIDKVLNIPVQELEHRLGELDKYKSKEIYVVCRSGHRSMSASQILSQNGFTPVNIKGGMIAYRSAK